MRILVADDDAAVRRSLGHALRRDGFAVAEARPTVAVLPSERGARLRLELPSAQGRT